MALQLGDTAPDFSAETTQGPIQFHEWKEDSWTVFFSHPKDFTPVCTTELGYTAALSEEFALRNVRAIAVSVDSVTDHRVVMVLHKAMMQDNAAKGVKKVKVAPKVVKSGTPQTKTQKVKKVAQVKRERLTKTGNPKDAANVFLDLIS